MFKIKKNIIFNWLIIADLLKYYYVSEQLIKKYYFKWKKLQLLQSNSKELTQPHDFEKLVKIYQDSITILNQSKINLKSLEDKTKKIPKSRKKMNIEQILQQLESNSEKFQDSSISIEDKVDLYRVSMSIINMARDKLGQQELEINYHD